MKSGCGNRDPGFRAELKAREVGFGQSHMNFVLPALDNEKRHARGSLCPGVHESRCDNAIKWRPDLRIAKRYPGCVDLRTRLFNASLDGSVRRAIDFREGDPVEEAALKALVQVAVALNTAR